MVPLFYALRMRAGNIAIKLLIFQPNSYNHIAMAHFVFRLIAPRATFPMDITPEEAAIMQSHAAYWADLCNRKIALIFGPVFDPRGAWGLGVVEVEDEAAAKEIVAKDPVTISSLCTVEILPFRLGMIRS